MHKSMILRSICILKRTSTMVSLCWFTIHNGIVTHVIFEATTSIAHVITPLTTLAETIVPVGNDELFHGSHPYRYLVRRACFALSSVSVSASTKARACFAFFHASCASCSVANLPRCWLVFPSQNCAIHDSFLWRLGEHCCDYCRLVHQILFWTFRPQPPQRRGHGSALAWRQTDPKYSSHLEH